MTEVFRKLPADRTRRDLMFAYDVVRELKFFDDIPDDVALRACRFFRYVKCARHWAVLDLADVRSYLTMQGVEPLTQARRLKSGRQKSKASQKAKQDSARSTREGSIALGKRRSMANLHGHEASDGATGSASKHRPPGKFYVILNGTVSVVNMATRAGANTGGNNANGLRGRNASSRGSLAAIDDTPLASTTRARLADMTFKDERASMSSGLTALERDRNTAHGENGPMDVSSGKKLCRLSRGDSFGEINVNRALERDSGRYMWITREESELIELDMDKYRRFLMRSHEREIEERVVYLRRLVVPLLTDYIDPLVFELAKALTKKICPHRKAILKRGDPGSRMYFIRKGEVTVLKHIEVADGTGSTATKYLRVAYLKPREYFGELSLLTNEPRATSVYCNSNVELLVMSKIDFTRFMSKSALDKMREYARGYPTEREIRKIYLKQQKWETYKKHVMEDECLIRLDDDLTNARDEEYIRKRQLRNARRRMRRLIASGSTAALARQPPVK